MDDASSSTLGTACHSGRSSPLLHTKRYATPNMSDKEKASEITKEAPPDEKPNDEPEVLRFPPEEEAVSINCWNVIPRFHLYSVLLHGPYLMIQLLYLSYPPISRLTSVNLLIYVITHLHKRRSFQYQILLIFCSYSKILIQSFLP